MESSAKSYEVDWNSDWAFKRNLIFFGELLADLNANLTEELLIAENDADS